MDQLTTDGTVLPQSLDCCKGKAFIEKHRQRSREYYTKNRAKNMAQCLYINRKGVQCVTQTKVICVDGANIDPYCSRHRKIK